MGWIILGAFLTGVFCFVIGAISMEYQYVGSYETGRMALWLIGIFLVFSLVTSMLTYNMIAERHSDGAPMADIELGTYKVAFAYRAGGLVTVGIEKPESDGREHLYVCQFKYIDLDLPENIPESIKKDAALIRAKWLRVFNKEGGFDGRVTIEKKYELME